MNIKLIIYTILGFMSPAFLIGYVNWDITIITTIGQWSSDARFAFAMASIAGGLFGSLLGDIRS